CLNLVISTFYSTIIHSGDAPKKFNEIHDNWTASLKFIKNVPEPIVNLRVNNKEHKGYMMQTNEILNGTLGKQGKKNEEDEDAMQENFNIDSNQMHSDDEFTERSPTRKNNLKGN
ncbi:9018_t:CDS:2, partial [Funneliformis mosseae]